MEQASLSASFAGDGIGPIIMTQARRVLERPAGGGASDRTGRAASDIEGLTIENRTEHRGRPSPTMFYAELSRPAMCFLKGPTATPRQGGKWPSMESANVAMRRELDLFANVRPVKVPGSGH